MYRTTLIVLLFVFSISLNTFSKNININSPRVWEQEVNYKLDVTLQDDNRTIEGSIEIEYINNSPDSLRVIYLKAFPNAIQKDSYADKKRRMTNNYSFAKLKPEEEGSLELFEISERINYRSISVDNSIIKIDLEQALAASDTLNLAFNFKTILPSPDNMRMGYERAVVKAVYWYPQVCVYDRKLGWVNSQYLGWGESYGDFGSFEVSITAPEDQIVAASGICVNEKEVLPDSLRELYDIKNFMKPKGEWPIFNFDENKTKTWKYVANKVNDFAFTTSNNWCIDSDSINGVEVIAYPLRNKAHGWESAVRLGKEAIETFSEYFYPYQWPVIRICDAFGGMEYPMITNCTMQGPSPSYSMLLYHEIGHQWFMGQVGSNQVDRPFLDEGFTTHMEHVIMEKYYGRKGNYNRFKTWYQRKFSPDFENRNVRGFSPMMQLIKSDYDKPLSFSYDQGEEYWTHRVSAYYKSAAMHYSLRSIFGDSLYFSAMHHYCDKWFFHHPYEEDFTMAMEEATGLELDNYLQQWYYSRKKLDYVFAGKSKSTNGHDYVHTIKLENKGELVSPIDIAIIWQQGDTTFYTAAPEGMDYAKPGNILLPVWNQFRRLDKKYEFKVKAKRDIQKVVIDPYNLLIDVNRLNNSSGFLPPIEFRLDNMKYDRMPVNEYALRWRPDLWYSETGGLQLGVHSHGSYLEIDKRFSLDFRLSTKNARPEIDLKYSSPFKPFGRNSFSGWHFLRADRRTYFSNFMEKKFKKLYSRDDYQLLRFEFNYLDLSGTQYQRFDPLPDDIVKYLPDNMWDANYTMYFKFYMEKFTTFRYGSYFIKMNQMFGRFTEFNRSHGFKLIQHRGGITFTNNNKQFFKLSFQYLDITGEPPSQFLPHLSRLSGVDQFVNSKLFRAPGTFPVKWNEDFYAANERVRGYQDRTIYITESMGGSLEITPPDLLPYQWFKNVPVIGRFLSKIDQTLFVDAAAISMGGKEQYYPQLYSTNETLSYGEDRELYLSAGISIMAPPVWSDHKLRIDFPLYLNKPIEGDEKFEFRFSVAWELPNIM